MKNDQLIAARRSLNPHRATIKLDVVASPDGAEAFTPYLIADPQTRGESVVVTTETAPNEVERMLNASIRSLL